MSQNLVVALGSLPKTSDPATAYTIFENMLIRTCNQGLVTFDRNGNVGPAVAKSWTLSDDYSEYTFFLDTTKKFTDMSSFNANDIKESLIRSWSVESYVTEMHKSVIGGMPMFRIIDEQTIKIKLKKPYPAFLYMLAHSQYSILKFNNPNIGISEYSFKIDQDTVKLDNVEDHRSIEAVKYSDNELKSLVEEEEIDIFFQVPPIFVDTYKGNNYQVMSMQDIAFFHLFFNTTRNNLSDFAKRSIIARVINKLGRKKNNRSFGQRPINTFIPNKTLPKEYYERDLDIDLENLAPIYPDKTPFKIVLVENIINTTFKQSISYYLAKLGLEAFFEEIPLMRSHRVVKEGDYDLFSIWSASNIFDPDGWLYLFMGDHKYRVQFIETDSLMLNIASVRYESDRIKRLTGYSQYIRQWEDQFYFVPLFNMDGIYLKKSEIETPNYVGHYDYGFEHIKK